MDDQPSPAWVYWLAALALALMLYPLVSLLRRFGKEEPGV